MISVGDVLLIPFPKEKKHYHVIVADIAENNCYACVFISSIKDNVPFDNACILRKGDAEFIRHDSYVVYQRLNFIDKADTERKIEYGIYKKQGTVSIEVLERIKAGANISRLIMPRHKKYFK